MKRKLLAIGGAAALLMATLGAPAQADAGKGGNLAVQNVTVTKPSSLAGKAAAPLKLVKGAHHGVPSKPGQVSTLALPSGYHYAGTNETPAASQAYFHSNMLISQPTCSGAGNHSLAELTVQYGSTTGAYRDNILEFGWACEVNAFTGSNTPHLLASCFRNNVGAGSYTGGCGYVDSGSFATNLGADLGPLGLNYIGLTKKFAIQYNAIPCGAASGGWWIWMDNWVGCFPTDSAAGHFDSAFTAGQFFQAFGETYKASSPGTCLGMGNDLFPTTTTTPTAYFNTLSHVTSGSANGNFNTAIQTDPTIYGALKLNPQVWRYGGKEVAPC